MAAIVVVCLATLTVIPMLLAKRGSDRQIRCAANLRQIGIALQSYAETHRAFPYAARWTAEDLPIQKVELQPRTGHATRENWVQLVLPHLGGERLAESFDRSSPMTDPRNAKARITNLQVLNCPEDSYNRPDNLYVYGDPDRDITASFARGNYAINGGAQSVNRYPGDESAPSTDGYRYSFDEGGARIWVSVSKVGGKFRTTGMADGSREIPPSIFRDGPRCVPPGRI